MCRLEPNLYQRFDGRAAQINLEASSGFAAADIGCIPFVFYWGECCDSDTDYNDHLMAKSIGDSIDFAAKRQVWQRMIL